MSNQINNIGSVLLEEYMKGYNIGFSDGFKEGREDAIAEIHSEMSYELAQLEVAGLSETTLRTFAYRIKAITENLLDKLKEKK